MLAAIAGGKEQSRFILLHDNVQSRGACLLRYITEEFLQRYDAVFAFLHESSDYQRYFENEDRLLFYDGVSNPPNWNTFDQPRDSSRFYLTDKLKTELQMQMKRKNIVQYPSDRPLRVAVVLDSLSSLICHQNITTLSQDLWQIMHLTEQDYEMKQVAAIIHGDLHEDGILSSINHMATTTIEMEPRPAGDIDHYDGYYTLIHCKKSGKVQRERECYKLDADCRLVTEKRKENGPCETPVIDTSLDVTSRLTFNLHLTEDEKEARSKLQLPYMLTDQVKQAQLSLGKKGQIFYEAEDVDDLDEEDPDDDLNI